MRALVIGRAAGVWDEVKQAQDLIKPNKFDIVVATNIVGCDYPGQLDHWVTFHVLSLVNWIAKRHQNGFAPALNYWTSPSQKKFQDRVPVSFQYVQCEGGSSGLLATCTALQVGATHVVLAGIPMEMERGQYDTDKAWSEAEVYRQVWEERLDYLKPTVRSLSGWTQRLLGAPTKEWLNEAASP